MSTSSELAQLRQQLVELQTQLAFQEDTITALDSIVARQQRQIEGLQSRWETHKAHLERISAELEKNVTDEKPPHY